MIKYMNCNLGKYVNMVKIKKQEESIEKQLWRATNKLQKSVVVVSISKSSIITSNILSVLQNIIQENLGSTSMSAKEFLQKEQCYKFLITIPDKEKLNTFDKYVRNTYHKLEVNRKQIKTLENMRDILLLPKLMSGEVRVKL